MVTVSEVKAGFTAGRRGWLGLVCGRVSGVVRAEVHGDCTGVRAGGRNGVREGGQGWAVFRGVVWGSGRVKKESPAKGGVV